VVAIVRYYGQLRVPLLVYDNDYAITSSLMYKKLAEEVKTKVCIMAVIITTRINIRYCFHSKHVYA